jgi:hypothetical protein
MNQFENQINAYLDVANRVLYGKQLMKPSQAVTQELIQEVHHC